MKMFLMIFTVLSSFLTNLETKTLQADFTVTVSEEADAPMNYPGKILMQGDKFHLDALDMEAAYDGKTMYMYSTQMDELTLTHPTDEELLEANPFRYAKALVPVCNVTEKASQDGKQTIITLTPKNRSVGINRFTLQVRNEDLMPLKVEIKEGRKNTVLKLRGQKFIPAKHEYVFVIKPSSNTFINDMRL